MTVYLDHNATAPLDGRVLEAMLPYLREEYGNPSSLHAKGREARAALERAREQVATLAGAHPSQIIFTGGGTEANNAALKGVALRRPVGRVAMSAVEHASVLRAAEALVRFGFTVDTIPVDPSGRVSEEALEQTIDRQTRVVSVMWANNETGVLQEIESLAAVARERGVPFHCDAVQAAGKVPLNFAAAGLSLMSLSAHKIGGPKGVGALVVEKAVDLEPLIHGGGQERDRRGGTENLPGIVGFGAAAELALMELERRRKRLLELRQWLERRLEESFAEMTIFAREAERLPNTIYMALPGFDGEALSLGLDCKGISVSSGAACGSHHHEPSRVLTAMGVAPELARGALRISLGWQNDQQDLEALVEGLQRQVRQLQAMAAAAW